jgi:hypothetical protein
VSAPRQPQPNPASTDLLTDVLEMVIAGAGMVLVFLVALPMLIPLVAYRVAGEQVATRTWFWVVWRWHWLANLAGVLVVVSLIGIEALLLAGWIGGGGAGRVVEGSGWVGDVAGLLLPWLVANLVGGVLLLPVAWSIKRRRIARLVRTRRVSDVVRQERIESARKRAADATVADRIGVRVHRGTGRILGGTAHRLSAPLPLPAGRFGFGMISRPTVRGFAERFTDLRRVRDWVDDSDSHLVLPGESSAARALVVAESGSGKTVLISGLVLCALEQGWPVFVLDAKGDPADTEDLARLARARDHTAWVAEKWNLFTGTADQITGKLMRLMPPPDGANQHYLNEIRGILQAVQDQSPLRSVEDLRERILNPAAYVRDQYDLSLITQTVDRGGTTAGTRVLQALLVALRPLEKWLAEDGWSYQLPVADLTVVSLTPVDDAQARLGDLMLLDLRNYLAGRLAARDRSPVLVVVDEFPQLVTDAQDPGDTAGSLFETARSAGLGLILATQSPAGLSNDAVRRRRALTSGAALIFGRSKDPEEMVQYAGTVMRMESSGRPTGEELGSARAQHTYVIPPQDVREAADGAFWLIQGGAIASFRALPNQDTFTAKPARVAAAR